MPQPVRVPGVLMPPLWDTALRNDAEADGGAPGGGFICPCNESSDCAPDAADTICVGPVCVRMPSICIILGKVMSPDPCKLGAVACPAAPDQSA